MNAQLFEPKEKEVTAIRIVSIKPKPEDTQQVEPVQLQWEGCPTKECVEAAVNDCKALITATQQLVYEIQNDADAEQRRLDKRVGMWRQEARVWEIKNSSRIGSCWFLLGADGYEVHPELPLALENLRRSGNWLGHSVESAQRGNFKDAKEYISAARKAARQAEKLVHGKVRPKSNYALVKLPRHLENRRTARSARNNRQKHFAVKKQKGALLLLSD